MAKSAKVRKVGEAQEGQLKVEYVPLDKLKPWAKNPRKNDEAAEFLVDKIQRYGFTDPIIATRDGTIRAGHARFKGAQMAGMESVPVIFMDFDSEAEAEMFSIAHNKASEQAEWDAATLSDLFGQLETVVGADEALAGTGFSQMDVEGLGEIKSSPEESFGREGPHGQGEQEHWVWMLLPSKAVFQALLKKYHGNASSNARELDTKLVLQALGIQRSSKVKKG